MKALFPIMLLSLSLCVTLGAAPAATPAATTQPASAPAAAPPELCQGAVDPYEQGEERNRFLQAAGADNELDEQEFQADKGKDKPFVRSFDRWDAMLTFDKNANKKIDWLEADAYRQDLRNRVLSAFDADKDGKLTGQERDSANRALAAGKVGAGTAASRPAGGFWRGTGGTGLWGADDPETIKKYDADGDGKLNDEERKAIRESWRKQAEEWRTKWDLQRHDKNKDGKLDEEELAAKDKEQAAWKERADKAMAEWTKKWDTNGDGKIDDEERKAMQESFRKQGEEWLAKWDLQRYDKNKDGKLDEEELAAKEKEQGAWKERADKYQKDLLQKYDTNGDGKLDDQERKAMTDEMVKKGKEAYQELIKKADADGDGKVSPKEYQNYWDNLRKKYDADGDGKLNEEERQKMMKDEGWGESSGGMWGGLVGGSSGPVQIQVNGRPLQPMSPGPGVSVMTNDDGSTMVIIQRQ